MCLCCAVLSALVGYNFRRDAVDETGDAQKHFIDWRQNAIVWDMGIIPESERRYKQRDPRHKAAKKEKSKGTWGSSSVKRAAELRQIYAEVVNLDPICPCHRTLTSVPFAMSQGRTKTTQRKQDGRWVREIT
jgi:hypothetical protein